MSALIVSFTVSLLINIVVLRFLAPRIDLINDSHLDGVQKVHTRSVPRVGGVGVFLGMSAGLISRAYGEQIVSVFGALLTLSALPVFCVGFVEDLIKKVSIAIRLLLTILSTVIAGVIMGAWLPSLQMFAIDHLMISYPIIAIVVTCFAVTGVVNSVNIIDGYNGISGVVSIMILSGLAYVAFSLDDQEILIAAFVMMGGILGFLIFNYPLGLVFLGDGGAYLIGFWIAELSVLLTVRHPEVSKWFPFLLCFYPICELLFTIFRRAFFLKTKIAHPDASHLHHLIYKGILTLLGRSRDNIHKQLGNSLTAPCLWVLSAFAVIPAIVFWDNVWALRGFSCLFITIYIAIDSKLWKRFGQFHR